MPLPRSRDRRWTSSFVRFVDSYGVMRLARELAVDPTAVYHWIRGATTPRPMLALQICRIARRRRITLSLVEIYRHGQLVRARRITAAERVATGAPTEMPEKAGPVNPIVGAVKMAP